MANKYVRSTDGVNTDDGSTWALANLDLVGGAADAAAGDTIYVSQSHAENTASGITITLAGTNTSPVKVICANDAAEPPTAGATTATVTASSTINMLGCGYYYGIAFKPGNGGSVSQSFVGGGATANWNQVYDSCSIQILTTGAGAAIIQLGDDSRSDSSRVWMRDTTIKFGGVNNRIKVACGFRWEGGSFVSGSASPVNVFQSGLRGMAEFLVTNVDFSANIGTSFNLMTVNSGGNPFTAKFQNIKLPTSWTGSLWSAAPTAPNLRVEVVDSLLGTAKLRYWAYDYAGQVRDETTIVRTGGFTDDTVLVSLKMASSADSEYPFFPLKGAPIFIYVDSSGSPVTKYIEFVHDSQGSGTASALRNDEIALEVSGSGGFISNVKASFVATSADHTTSTETWTTTGLTTPVKQKMAVTFTPTRKGEYTITPVLYAASKTVYVCPKVA